MGAWEGGEGRDVGGKASGDWLLTGGRGATSGERGRCFSSKHQNNNNIDNVVIVILSTMGADEGGEGLFWVIGVTYVSSISSMIIGIGVLVCGMDLF